MEFNQYQLQAAKTAIYPAEYKVTYPVLEMTNEAGEVAGKWKKVLRDQGGQLTEANRVALAQECGDVLWALAACCTDLGLTLDDVAQANLEKLASRQSRGVLGGSGDNR